MQTKFLIPAIAIVLAAIIVAWLLVPRKNGNKHNRENQGNPIYQKISDRIDAYQKAKKLDNQEFNIIRGQVATYLGQNKINDKQAAELTDLLDSYYTGFLIIEVRSFCATAGTGYSAKLSELRNDISQLAKPAETNDMSNWLNNFYTLATFKQRVMAYTRNEKCDSMRNINLSGQFRKLQSAEPLSGNSFLRSEFYDISTELTNMQGKDAYYFTVILPDIQRGNGAAHDCATSFSPYSYYIKACKEETDRHKPPPANN